MMQAEIEAIPNKWYLEVDCLQHQYQLLTLAQLTAVNKVLVPSFGHAEHSPGSFTNYFGVVARMFHLWREHARAFYTAYADQPGVTAKEAFDVCARIPPKPLVGRWNQITLCERHALRGSPPALTRAFFQVHILTLMGP